MLIEVFSDVVCPWCYIGKRRLESALSTAGIPDADVRGRAFQLNPDLPPEGVDRRQYLEAKFGGPEGAARIHDRVRQAGRTAGIDFRFEDIARSPNTFDAHRLLRLAAQQGKQGAMKENLMQAYFLKGRDVGDRPVLTEIARETGIDGDVGAWLGSDAEATGVREDLAAARQLQISGVPFFIFGGRYAIAGAQPAEIFVQALDAARRLPDPGTAQPIG
jgi:predicted DsbA family dithiol-disulfide isomerase